MLLFLHYGVCLINYVTCLPTQELVHSPTGFIQLNLLAFKPIKGQQIRKRAPHNQCVSLLIYERYSV